MTNFGPTGRLVYERTYSRTKPDGSKETWPETVERVVDGNLALVDERHQLLNERQDLIDMMNEFKILPAGRHIWASGVKNAEHLFNCWVSGWTADPAEHFEFTFMRLMEGGGVGTNYSNRFLTDLPKIVNMLDVHIVCDEEHPDYDLIKESGVLSQDYSPEWAGAFPVEDSREGWAAALTNLIDTHYLEGVRHTQRVYDVSRVRHAGAPLKTFGGSASGPLPLASMLIQVAAVFSSRAGEHLDGISAMEVDHAIAQCVVAGGVRRSARMAMMHWADAQIFDFINIKEKSLSHWTTNISVEVDDEFWYQVKQGPAWHAAKVLQAITEGMVNNGEPGMWDSSLSNVGEPNRVVCTNPCLTGDTVIATLNGPRTFADLAESGEDVEVYSWHPQTKMPVVRWMRKPRKTRENAELLKITFDSGLVVRSTLDHSFFNFRGKKVKAKDLKVGQSVRAFSASRDGSGHERVHAWDSKRDKAVHQWTHRMVWENEHGPVPDGLHVAHLDGDAYNNQIENLSAMTPYEHASYDYPARFENGFHHPAMKNHKVVSVEDGGRADVYNGTVDDSHTYIILDPDPVAGHMSGIVSANCGEITLQEWEPCNLGHINLAGFVKDNGKVDGLGLLKAHRLMTRFLIRATFSAVSDPKSREVLDRNRRIGVGHFGVASFLAMTGKKYSQAPKDKRFKNMLRELSQVVDQSAEGFCHELRIPVPVKKRTIAPTGTIAKLPGVSEGIHPIFARYFIRRVRLSKVDQDQVMMLKQYEADGYQVEDCQYAANTAVVAIPTKDTLVQAVTDLYGRDGEDLVEAADDLTLKDLLAFQALYQQCWADNAVSFTANVDPARYKPEHVEHLLVEFAGKLKGSTIFPESSMPQAPYERLEKWEYEGAIAKQVSDGIDEECSTGACPIR